jgi:hypothetical protein
MKGIFMLPGLALAASVVGLALHLTWAWWSAFVLSVPALWDAPFGSMAGLISIIVLLLAPLR